MKTTKRTIKSRVLEEISSKHGMRDLCKFSEKNILFLIDGVTLKRN